MKRYLLILKFAVSTLLIAYMVHTIDFSPLKAGNLHFHPEYYLMALVLMVIYLYVQSYILKSLLLAKNITAKRFDIMRVLVISTFFGVFLPGGSGADLVLCYNLCRSTDKKAEVLSTIAASRIGATFIMVVMAFVFSFYTHTHQTAFKLFSACLLVVCLSGYLVVTNAKCVRWTHNILLFMEDHKWMSFFHKTYFTVSNLFRNKFALMKVLPLFACIGITRVFFDYFIAKSLGFDLPLIYFFIVIPWTSLAVIVPLTIAGIGVREGAYVGLFWTLGVEKATAFCISLLSFSLTLWICVAGAILYGLGTTRIAMKDAIQQSGQNIP